MAIPAAYYINVVITCMHAYNNYEVMQAAQSYLALPADFYHCVGGGRGKGGGSR